MMSHHVNRRIAIRQEKAYALLLNWNGWADTLECLESLLRSDYRPFQIVVCDNDSSDESVERFHDWAAGRLDIWSSCAPEIRCLTWPPVPKPVDCVEYDRGTAERGGDHRAAGARVILIRTGANRGYAAGNNVGLRYILARGDAAYVWLLNNDTVVRADTLSRMTHRVGTVENAGMCGARILYYSDPGIVQSLGGFRYNRWSGTARQLGHGARDAVARETPARTLEARTFGIYGASQLVTAEFLRRVGLLPECYFLYFEEQDWAVRATRVGLRKVLATDAVVYHKEGAATGGSEQSAMERSYISDYHSIRSRLLFTRRFFPYALPSVYLALLGSIANRLRRRQFDRVEMVVKVAVETLFRHI